MYLLVYLLSSSVVDGGGIAVSLALAILVVFGTTAESLCPRKDHQSFNINEAFFCLVIIHITIKFQIQEK